MDWLQYNPSIEFNNPRNWIQYIYQIKLHNLKLKNYFSIVRWYSHGLYIRLHSTGTGTKSLHSVVKTNSSLLIVSDQSIASQKCYCLCLEYVISYCLATRQWWSDCDIFRFKSGPVNFECSQTPSWSKIILLIHSPTPSRSRNIFKYIV